MLQRVFGHFVSSRQLKAFRSTRMCAITCTFLDFCLPFIDELENVAYWKAHPRAGR
jgi:hypothetical protein